MSLAQQESCSIVTRGCWMKSRKQPLHFEYVHLTYLSQTRRKGSLLHGAVLLMFSKNKRSCLLPQCISYYFLFEAILVLNFLRTNYVYKMSFLFQDTDKETEISGPFPVFENLTARKQCNSSPYLFVERFLPGSFNLSCR